MPQFLHDLMLNFPPFCFIFLASPRLIMKISFIRVNRTLNRHELKTTDVGISIYDEQKNFTKLLLSFHLFY